MAMNILGFPPDPRPIGPPKECRAICIVGKKIPYKETRHCQAPLTKDFSNDYQVISCKVFEYMTNMLESHLLRGLMWESVLFEAHDHAGKSINDL